MAPFTRPKAVKAVSRSRFSLERDAGADPLAAAIAPEADETAEARSSRLAREDEEKRVSDEIDKQLEHEAKEKRRQAKAVNELQILLLGPTGAGKTTFLRQMRMQYDIKGLDAEREAHRLVILLNVIQTSRTLLSLLDNDTASSPLPTPLSLEPNLFQPLGAGGRTEASHTLSLAGPRNEQESNYRRRVRLAPLLGLEAPLRESLGVVASGPSAASLSAHALDRSVNGEGVQKLGWRDASPLMNGSGSPSSYAPDEDTLMSSSNGGEKEDSARLTIGPSSRRHQVRSRAASPVGGESEPLFSPNFAQTIGSFAFGSGKESRRARAQGTKPGSNTSVDGHFLAGPEDPIHLLAALKDEVTELWKEAVDRGLISGEGPKEGIPGGFEITESARFFLTSLNRIARPDWLPTDDDILNVRVRTLGIEQHCLQITPNQIYRICDVAGARGVKHSWAPYFEGAASLIFIVAVSDYTVCDPTDLTANRLADALELFRDIATNKILENVTMIVFMNKIDVLRRKIKSNLYPLEKYMPTFTGGTKSKIVLHYLQGQFEHAHQDRKKPLYCYATQANDTKSVRFVIAAINDVLMRGTLAASGLL